MVPCESYLLWLPVRVTGYGYLRELLVRVTDESHRYSVRKHWGTTRDRYALIKRCISRFLS